MGSSGETVKSWAEGHKVRGEEMTSGALTNGGTTHGCTNASVSVEVIG